MKKLLLFLTIFSLAFSLAACGGGDDDNDPTCEADQTLVDGECVDNTPTCGDNEILVDNECEAITLSFSGVADATVEKDTVFNVLDGVSVSGTDNNDYTSGLTVTSPDCYIDDNNLLETTTPRTCIVEYSATGAGSFVREQVTVTITQPTMEYPEDFGPDLKVWNFDSEADLEGFGVYTAGGGALEMSIEDGAMKLVTESGGQRYETRLDFMGLQFEEGEYYYWQFDAKSDIDGKKIHLNFGHLLPSDPWFAPFKVEGQDFVTLSTEWETYSIYFTAEDLKGILGDLTGGPLFEMGNIEGSIDLDATIWIDNMIIAGGSGVDVFAPILTGVENLTIYVEDNATFDPLAGVMATDNMDGDITANITVTGHTVDPTVPGTYLVKYSIYDAANNHSQATRVVTVMNDTEGPVVAGNDTVEVQVGSNFDPLAGVTATDGRDGDLTASIVLGGDPFDIDVAGVYNLTYTVSDAVGNETVATRIVTVSAMIWLPTEFLDGDFEAAWNPFYDSPGWAGDPSLAFYKVNDNGELEIDVQVVGGANWSVLFESTFNIDLVVGKTYRLTFDAKADAARTIQANLAYGGDHIVDVVLTTEMATYTADFVFDGTEDTTGQIKMMMGLIDGALPGVVTFDNMKFEEFDGAAVVADTDQVVDPGFDAWPMNGWSAWADGIDFSLNVEWNELVYRYANAGGAGWSNQVNFENIPFVYGETYKVTFSAKGDAARDFDVTIYDGAMDFRSAPMALGTDFAEYEHVFTYLGGDSAKLSFELGTVTPNNAGTIFILDNVVIEVLEQEELITNGDFEDNGGWSFWSKDALFWPEDPDTLLTNMTVEYINGEAKVTYDNIGQNAWEAQFFQANLPIEADGTYRVTFDAYADVARAIKPVMICEGGGAEEYRPVDPVQITTTKDTYTFDFTVSGTCGTDGLGQVDFELGIVEGTETAGWVTFDNIYVEKLDVDSNIVPDSNLVLNPTFTEVLDWDFWSKTALFWPEDPDTTLTNMTVELMDGEAKVSYDAIGANAWEAQFFQAGLVIDDNGTYTITFDAYADVDRAIKPVLICEANGVEEYRPLEAIAITTVSGTYSYTFTIDGSCGTDGLGQIDFELGVVEGTETPGWVKFDNIMIFRNYNPLPAE